MSNDPAPLYFQKLEREAKLANRLTDETDHGALIQAVCKGIPPHYTSMIANISFGISRTYPEWKRCICQMYDERQKQWVFNETHDLKSCHEKHPGNQKQITATSSSKAAGGVTSSSMGKTTGNGKSRDSGRRWISVTTKTYRGQGELMQIDWKKYMAEGRCFNCHEKGHISKDCLKKQKKEVRMVTMGEDTPLADSTKVEEVKE